MEPLGPATCSPHVPGEGRPLMGEVRLPTRGAHPGSPRCHGPHGSVRTPSTPAVTALWFLYPWPWTRQAALGPRESLSSPQPQDHKNHGCKLNSLPVGAEPRAKQGGGRGAGAARSTTPRQGRRSRARSELSHPWDFPGKNTEVGCHFLLQGIFPTQGLNLCLLHWQSNS